MEQKSGGEAAAFESKLIPIMREGVEVIKMIFFRKLRDRFEQKYVDREAAFRSKLAGAVINSLFGTSNPDPAFVTFNTLHQEYIDHELKNIGTDFAEMRIPLTDALRVQFLCDSMEGRDNPSILAQARDLAILLVERDVPLPKNFLALVRRLGSAFNILVREQTVH